MRSAPLAPSQPPVDLVLDRVPDRGEGQVVAVVISPDQYDGVIFDMDGVITDTASVHAAAWRRMFDEFLGSRTAGPHEDIRSSHQTTTGVCRRQAEV